VSDKLEHELRTSLQRRMLARMRMFRISLHVFVLVIGSYWAFVLASHSDLTLLRFSHLFVPLLLAVYPIPLLLGKVIEKVFPNRQLRAILIACAAARQVPQETLEVVLIKLSAPLRIYYQVFDAGTVKVRRRSGLVCAAVYLGSKSANKKLFLIEVSGWVRAERFVVDERLFNLISADIAA
jgi:hypothetical protein